MNTSGRRGGVIIHADDLGYSDAVTHGILDAHTRGIVTSTAFMTNMPGTEAGAAAARAHPDLETGLHVNLTEGRPLTDARTLRGKDGDFRDLNGQLIALTTGRVSQGDIDREVDAQWRRMADLGLPIRHLNGHQHIHLFGGVLDATLTLARKHRIATDDLPAKFLELAAELERLEKVDEDLASLQREVDAAVTAWRAAASQLSSERSKASAELARDISARMQTLGMTGGKFVVQLHKSDGAEPTLACGLEDVGFEVSANAGQPPRPIGKVASGGELSRLSLAVQVALASRIKNSGAGGCMVFDEVDSGVGGAVAEIVGRELALLGRSAQVLCVTHLPQVAALGNRHLRVSKLTDGRTTRTQVVTLEQDARIEEIARMLGGVTITDKAREHASEMLEAGAALSRSSAPRDAGSSSSGSARRSRGRGR